jgi:phage-related baseplate assembly protein
MTSTTRFSASSLDLSLLDRKVLWPGYSFQSILDARLTLLQSLFVSRGIEYDVFMLETDPGRILQEASAYRELLTSYSIDDAQAAVLLAFAKGAHLDRLGDLHGTARAEGETDDRYRARIQLAPEAFSSAGTLGGYLYHAMSVSLDIRDVAINIINKGTNDVGVELTVLSKIGDGEPSDTLMRAIRDKMFDASVRLVTDAIYLRAARVVDYDVVATLHVRKGPDPALIKSTATASLAAVADRYKRVGGDVPASALQAAMYVSGVDRVDMTSPGDLDMLRFQAANMNSSSITVKLIEEQ